MTMTDIHDQRIRQMFDAAQQALAALRAAC
jgi:hypothetical protein